MANQRISALPNLPASGVSNEDLFLIVDVNSYIDQNGQSKNITMGDMISYIRTNLSLTGEGIGTVVESSIYQSTHSFSAGNVIRMDPDLQIYVTASANSTTGKESELVGIVNYVKDVDNFIMVTNGVVDFEYAIEHSQSILLPSGSLEAGITYFLGDQGLLYNYDPTIFYPTWLSKPFMVGISSTQAVITNYRGFFRPNGEDATLMNLYVTSSNTFVIGDAVRKTTDAESSSFGQWVLSTADSFSGSQVVGLVAQASPSHFLLNLAGNIGGLTNLESGELYYLVQSASINYSATQSRNLLPLDTSLPYQYSKPVMLAVSPTSGVIINERSIYNKVLESTSSISSPSTPSSQSFGSVCFPSQFTPLTTDVTMLMDYLYPTGSVGDTAIVYWVQPFNSNPDGNFLYVPGVNMIQWPVFRATSTTWAIQ